MKHYIGALGATADLPDLCPICAADRQASAGRMRDTGQRCVRLFCGCNRIGCIVVEGGAVHVIEAADRVAFFQKADAISEDLPADGFRTAGLH